MRVTQRMINRNYTRQMNTSFERYNESFRQMTEHTKYKRFSDNVSAGSRALSVRKQLSATRKSYGAVSDAEGPLNAAESNLMSINEHLQTVYGKLIEVMGVSDSSKYEIIGKEIGGIKDQVIQLMNSKFADKFLFAGTNNSSAPFKFDDDNNLLFNGVKASDILQDADGLYYNNAGGDRIPVPQSGDTYIDVGLGLEINNGEVDPRTAFLTSFSGIEILGFGVDADGEPNNVFEIIAKMEDTLRNPPGGAGTQPDTELLGKLNDKLKKRTEEYMINVTELGNRQNFLEKMKDRLKDDETHLLEMQNLYETVKPEEAVIEMESYRSAYQAVLKMGAQILPLSLMDYLN